MLTRRRAPRRCGWRVLYIFVVVVVIVFVVVVVVVVYNQLQKNQERKKAYPIVSY